MSLVLPRKPRLAVPRAPALIRATVDALDRLWRCEGGYLVNPFWFAAGVDAFPVVDNTITSTSSGATHTCSTPAGSGGRVYLVFAGSKTTDIVDPTGWDVLVSSDGTDAFLRAYTKDGATGTVDISVPAGGKSSHVALRVSGGGDAEAATATGSSDSQDPPNLSPLGGPKKYLWLVIKGHTRAKTQGAYPTNYDDNQLTATADEGDGGTASVRAAAATRNLEAGSDDPSAFTTTGGGAAPEYAAATIAIPPA